ncbi:uncharacterized protein H6S33_012405 [Morchella sextelata]|uniref:uncharacterized protein n=1 Tax=Morchella sextelata TaxID=1174677 RepID=UPI001D03D8E2|nr:uncharacterized protein H6S33_012405 [Morchella sextelata]KAH0609859.1 hypothetical protein H6S33_012405 [Morchella sextelata]
MLGLFFTGHVHEPSLESTLSYLVPKCPRGDAKNLISSRRLKTFNKRNIWIDGRVVMALASGASGATRKTYSLVQFRSAKRSSFWYNHPPPLAYLPPVINVSSNYYLSGI